MTLRKDLLRDQFNREYKKVLVPKSGDSANSAAPVYNGKWSYFQAMAFVKDMVTARATSSNLHNVEDSTSSFEETVLEEEKDETEVNNYSNQYLPMLRVTPNHQLQKRRNLMRLYMWHLKHDARSKRKQKEIKPNSSHLSQNY